MDDRQFEFAQSRDAYVAKRLLDTVFDRMKGPQKNRGTFIQLERCFETLFQDLLNGDAKDTMIFDEIFRSIQSIEK